MRLTKLTYQQGVGQMNKNRQRRHVFYYEKLKRETVGYAFVSQQQAWSFYHFTKNSENQAMAMVNDISKWMPIPQPPSEVQDD